MKVTALVVSDDVRDICDDNELPHPMDVDAWLAAHEARIEEAMEYAGKQEVRRLIDGRSDPKEDQSQSCFFQAVALDAQRQEYILQTFTSVNAGEAYEAAESLCAQVRVLSGKPAFVREIIR